MSQSYEPRATASAPAQETTAGRETAAPQRASAARGNQAMQERLPPAAPDCALGDDEACGLEVSLDEILGDGALADIHAVMAQITGLADGIIKRLLILKNPELTTKYAEHTDGAANLNALLSDKGVALQASAQRDERGELTWDYALEMQLLVAQGHAELAIDVLTAVEQVLDAKLVEPLLAGAAAFAQLGAGALERLRIRSESGYRQLETLLAMYEERRESFETNRNAVAKQSASMLMGPLDKTLKAKGHLKRVWTLGNALLTATSTPAGPWETIKAVKSVGFAAVSEYTRVLGEEAPFSSAWGELSKLVNTCQLIVDLGPTIKDFGLMKDLADHARAVRDEYAIDMDFYETNRDVIAAQVAGLARFAVAGAALDAQVTAAEASIAAAGADAPSFYAPFN